MKRPAKNQQLIYKGFDWLLRHVLRVLPASRRTELWALWWGYRFQPAPRVVSLRSGAKIYVARTDHLQLLIYYLGTFEDHCLSYLRRCVTRGGTVVDIGANIGLYTLECAISVGSEGRVISIEAAPTHLESLCGNIELNDLKNVSVIGSAVGEIAGHATLTLPRGDNLGMFTLGETDGDEAYKVEVDTIDALLEKKDIKSLDLIKMDVEGSEFMALRGATRTLEKFHPSLLIELNEIALRRCGSSTSAVKKMLVEMGYRGWRIGRSSVESITENDVGGDCEECLYIHVSRQSLMRKLGVPM